MMPVDCVYRRIGAVDKCLDTVDGATVRRPVKGRVSASIAGIDVSTSRKQQFHAFSVLAFGRVVKSRSTVTVHCIHL